jgi:hypothetical protein
LETPDVTPIQIRAAILWVVSVLALVGVQVSDAVSNQIITISLGFVTALPVILVYADAIIRKARAQNLTAIVESKRVLAPPAPAYFGDGSDTGE